MVFECHCPNHPDEVFAAFEAETLAGAVREWSRQRGSRLAPVPACDRCGERQKHWRQRAGSLEYDPSQMTLEEAKRDMERAVLAFMPDRAPFILAKLSHCSVGAHAAFYEKAKRLYFAALAVADLSGAGADSPELRAALDSIRNDLGER